MLRIKSSFYQISSFQHFLNVSNSFFSDAGCFPQRIDACKNHFINQYGTVAAYSCEGECGLCDLCGAATKEVPECTTYCVAGKQGCIDTCNKGKAACIACGVL